MPKKEVKFKTTEERKLHLKKAMQELNKKYGIEVLHYGSEEAEWIKTPFGVPELDKILGGGIAFGKFTVLWGSRSSGKTSLAYYLTAQAQKAGKVVYFIALEPFDAERAAQFGVNLEELIIGRFPIAEQSLDSIIDFARKKLVDVVILDSIHSLSPKAEQREKSGKEKSIEEDTMALLARKLSQFFRIATDPISRANIAVLLIGQTRTSIGFIAIEQLTGGNALKHYSKLILHIRRGKKIDSPRIKIETDELNEKGKKKKITKIIGFDCVIKIDKTQTPGTKSELTEIHLPYYFKTGFDEPIAIKEERKCIEKEIEEQFKEKKKRGRPCKKGG